MRRATKILLLTVGQFLFTLSVTAYTFVAGYPTLSAGYNAIVSDFRTVTGSFWPLFFKNLLLIGMLFILCLLIIFIIRTLQSVRGRSAGPLGIIQLFRLYTPRRLIKVIYAFHRFQHTLCQCDDKLRQTAHGAMTLGSYGTRDVFRTVLDDARDFCCLALATDVSVHIKIFERDSTTPGVTMERLDNTSLVTYERVDSVGESNRREKGDLRARTRTERFKVIVGTDGSPQQLKRNFPESISQPDGRVNSAYCYTLGNKKHFWIQNNLIAAEQEGTFYSTSEDWKNYYRSLAVFLIAPPVPAGEHLAIIPFGLFIIDSTRTGVFDYYITKNIGGYIAHRLHFLFRSVYTAQQQGRTTSLA